MASIRSGRLVATSLAVVLSAASLTVLGAPAHAEEVELTYDCSGPAGPDSPESPVELSVTPLTELGEVTVGDELKVALEVGGAALPLDVMAQDTAQDTAQDGDATVSAVDVHTELRLGEDGEDAAGVQLSGSPAPHKADWVLSGELTATEAGTFDIQPGDMEIIQFVFSDSDQTGADEEKIPAPESTPESLASDCVLMDAPDHIGELEVTDNPEGTEYSGESGESEESWDSENSEDSEGTGDTEPEPETGPTESPSPQPGVSSDGGFDWSGPWVCSSADPDLIDSFAGPGTASAVVAEELEPHTPAEVTAEFSFADIPVPGDVITAGAMTATLGVSVDGEAVSATELDFTTTNSADLAADDSWIEFEVLEPQSVTPQQPGELQLQLGELTLTTELEEGTVTHTCVATSEPEYGEPEYGGDDSGSDLDNPQSPALPDETTPRDDALNLPLTGSSLAGLATTAVLALVTGGIAVLLGRRRHSNPDSG